MGSRKPLKAVFTVFQSLPASSLLRRFSSCPLSSLQSSVVSLTSIFSFPSSTTSSVHLIPYPFVFLTSYTATPSCNHITFFHTAPVSISFKITSAIADLFSLLPIGSFQNGCSSLPWWGSAELPPRSNAYIALRRQKTCGSSVWVGRCRFLVVLHLMAGVGRSCLSSSVVRRLGRWPQLGLDLETRAI